MRVRCKVSLGMFTRERVVEVGLRDGSTATLVVDKSAVEVEREPGPGEAVPGFLRAGVVEEAGDHLLVDLPQPTFSGGGRVEIARDLVAA